MDIFQQIQKHINDKINSRIAKKKQAKPKVITLSPNISFYKFVTEILGYTLLLPHKEWCESIDKPFTKKLLLKPRGTYKSTIYTKAYSLYRLMKNPNMRILIISSTFENASDFMTNIQNIILSHSWFQKYNIGFKNKNQRSLNLTIRNEYHSREPNLMAIGTFSRSLVGRHFDLIICDDIVNNDDRESQNARDKKKRWFQDVFSLLDPGGQVLVVGTRWHFNDLYDTLINEKKWPHEIETPMNKDGTCRFEPILTEEILQEKEFELGTIHYSSQYWNNPLPEGSAVFYKKYFEKGYDINVNKKNLTFYGYCDLALGQSKTSDYTAIITLATDGEFYYVYDVMLERLTPDHTIQRIITLFDIYNYKNFGVEDNLFQTLFKESLKNEMQRQGKRHHIYIHGVKNTKKKEVRIETIQPYLARGLLLFPSDWKDRVEFTLLIDQMLHFPVADHDDGPDALEGVLSVARTANKMSLKIG